MRMMRMVPKRHRVIGIYHWPWQNWKMITRPTWIEPPTHRPISSKRRRMMMIVWGWWNMKITCHTCRRSCCCWINPIMVARRGNDGVGLVTVYTTTMVPIMIYHTCHPWIERTPWKRFNDDNDWTVAGSSSPRPII